MKEDKKFAIFIDGDNISPKYLEAILSEVAKDGDILIRRIYGDWTEVNMKGWKDLLLRIPVRPVQQFRNGNNATDNAIIMDAIELVNTNKEINALCIVTSDTDYYSLALKIREYGLFVLGIGEKKSNERWIKSCNEFKYLENFSIHQNSIQEILGDKDEKELSLYILIAQAYEYSNTNESGLVSLSSLGTSIRNIRPDFSPENYNYKTLRSLLESLSDYYELSNDGLLPPNYYVKSKSKYTGTRRFGVIKRWIHNYGIITEAEGLGDFFFYISNISSDDKDHKIKQGDRVSFKIFSMPNPDADDKRAQNGRASEIKFEM